MKTFTRRSEKLGQSVVKGLPSTATDSAALLIAIKESLPSGPTAQRGEFQSSADEKGKPRFQAGLTVDGLQVICGAVCNEDLHKSLPAPCELRVQPHQGNNQTPKQVSNSTQHTSAAVQQKIQSKGSSSNDAHTSSLPKNIHHDSAPKQPILANMHALDLATAAAVRTSPRLADRVPPRKSSGSLNSKLKDTKISSYFLPAGPTPGQVEGSDTKAKASLFGSRKRAASHPPSNHEIVSLLASPDTKDQCPVAKVHNVALPPGPGSGSKRPRRETSPIIDQDYYTLEDEISLPAAQATAPVLVDTASPHVTAQQLRQATHTASLASGPSMQHAETGKCDLATHMETERPEQNKAKRAVGAATATVNQAAAVSSHESKLSPLRRSARLGSTSCASPKVSDSPPADTPGEGTAGTSNHATQQAGRSQSLFRLPGRQSGRSLDQVPLPPNSSTAAGNCDLPETQADVSDNRVPFMAVSKAVRAVAPDVAGTSRSLFAPSQRGKMSSLSAAMQPQEELLATTPFITSTSLLATPTVAGTPPQDGADLAAVLPSGRQPPTTKFPVSKNVPAHSSQQTCSPNSIQEHEACFTMSTVADADSLLADTPPTAQGELGTPAQGNTDGGHDVGQQLPLHRVKTFTRGLKRKAQTPPGSPILAENMAKSATAAPEDQATDPYDFPDPYAFPDDNTNPGKATDMQGPPTVANPLLVDPYSYLSKNLSPTVKHHHATTAAGVKENVGSLQLDSHLQQQSYGHCDPGSPILDELSDIPEDLVAVELGDALRAATMTKSHSLQKHAEQPHAAANTLLDQCQVTCQPATSCCQVPEPPLFPSTSGCLTATTGAGSSIAAKLPGPPAPVASKVFGRDAKHIKPLDQDTGTQSQPPLPETNRQGLGSHVPQDASAQDPLSISLPPPLPHVVSSSHHHTGNTVSFSAPDVLAAGANTTAVSNPADPNRHRSAVQNSNATLPATAAAGTRQNVSFSLPEAATAATAVPDGTKGIRSAGSSPQQGSTRLPFYPSTQRHSGGVSKLLQRSSSAPPEAPKPPARRSGSRPPAPNPPAKKHVTFQLPSSQDLDLHPDEAAAHATAPKSLSAHTAPTRNPSLPTASSELSKQGYRQLQSVPAASAAPATHGNAANSRASMAGPSSTKTTGLAARQAPISPMATMLGGQSNAQRFIAQVLSEVAPAQSITEAQERGELVQVQDDAVYALDGLSPTSSVPTQRDSALTLAEIASTRRGRAALRADGLAQQILTAAAKLRGHKDMVVAGAFACLLLALSQEDAPPQLMASLAAATLASQLLQAHHEWPQAGTAAASEPSMRRLLRLATEGPLARQVHKHGQAPTSCLPLVLLSLAQATSTHTSKIQFSDKVKKNLHLAQVVDKLGKLAAHHYSIIATTLQTAAGEAEAVAQLLQGPLLHELYLCIVVLENATFTCADNELTLLQMQIELDGTVTSASESQEPAPQVPKQTFISLLLQMVNTLAPHIATTSQARDCTHVSLAVLMNITHQHPEGVQQAAGSGGLEVTSQLLYQCCSPSRAPSGQILTRLERLLQFLEVVSVCMGMLINMTSASPDNRQQLRGINLTAPTPNHSSASAPAATAARTGTGTAEHSTGGMLAAHITAGSSDALAGQTDSMLPGTTSAVAADAAAIATPTFTASVAATPTPSIMYHTTGDLHPAINTVSLKPAVAGWCDATASCSMLQLLCSIVNTMDESDDRDDSSQERCDSDSGGAELTCDDVQTGQKDGEASIVQVYASMLLGFLIQDDEVSREAAKQLLGGSLAVLVGAVERCLAFYVSAGAITDASRQSLMDLLSALKKAEGLE